MCACHLVRAGPTDGKTSIARFIYSAQPNPTAGIRFRDMQFFESRWNIRYHLFECFYHFAYRSARLPSQSSGIPGSHDGVWRISFMQISK